MRWSAWISDNMQILSQSIFSSKPQQTSSLDLFLTGQLFWSHAQRYCTISLYWSSIIWDNPNSDIVHSLSNLAYWGGNANFNSLRGGFQIEHQNFDVPCIVMYCYMLYLCIWIYLTSIPAQNIYRLSFIVRCKTKQLQRFLFI